MSLSTDDDRAIAQEEHDGVICGRCKKTFRGDECPHCAPAKMDFIGLASLLSANGKWATELYFLDGKIHMFRVFVRAPYEVGVEVMRKLGIRKWKKEIYETWSTLGAELDGVNIIIFTDSLPPTCRLVEVVEKVPKTQTVDTGEFIEVKRMKVECNEPKEAA